MYRFKLVGSYEILDVTYEVMNGEETVYVPLLTKQEIFDYGIGRVLDKMLQSGICPTEKGIDVLAFATLVYVADTRISRMLHSQDSWTREIAIQLPVSDLEAWNNVSEELAKMLNFLTGDKWSVLFEERTRMFKEVLLLKRGDVKDFDTASLFSGGMDSLISTINYLEEKKKLVLISHAGDGYTKNAQNNIIDVLEKQYGELETLQLNLWMVFDKDFIPNGETETSTRSRSFLFIAFAVFVISGLQDVEKLEIPENGLIALNVPLDNLRVGSHSTRTTHPFYLGMWNNILYKLGFGTLVENSYWDKTKGEMADECSNKDLLYKLMPKSVSCSSPGKARWLGFNPQHCGYCVPCLIRRAAMQRAFGFGQDNTEYTEPNISEIQKMHDKGIGVQLRSFQVAINRLKDNPNVAKLLIHKPGPLASDNDYLNRLVGVYSRGLMEVDSFIQEAINNEVDNNDV